ncbi:hypothetical protein SAMN03159341_1439 [Paenibacillus sp. 1_12]|uniref:hypothetical protein n=1 Tax=Paenibacillus sp. 1_12 TaxID=1566278 RepID=UPI0008E27C88|nr:hypothetical protein [Paenibacillus sp. 1_12]SFM52818.1 hypothetical protein SAMN03159341_1439 [Paenibacillus sp. 1_12]
MKASQEVIEQLEQLSSTFMQVVEDQRKSGGMEDTAAIMIQNSVSYFVSWCRRDIDLSKSGEKK